MEKSRSEKIRDEKNQKREDVGARKDRKIAIYLIWGSGRVEK